MKKRHHTRYNKRYSKRRRQQLIRKWKKKIPKIQWKELLGKFTKDNVKATLFWLFRISVAVLLAFVFVWYFGQRISTVGDSMKPVLENGDVVLVNRFIYSTSSPKRGDVIAFKPKGNKNSHYYIKRIIGLPGETIEIIENSIYIDGEKLEEDYVTTDIDRVGVVSDSMTLGNDEYFVLGDDRENSEDSRNADVGNVKRSYIYGKVWFISSPFRHFGFVK